MGAHVVGLAAGTPYQGIGVVVLDPAGEVVEAATLTPAVQTDPAALGVAAVEAVGLARAILADHASGRTAVWAVVTSPTGRPGRQQQRAAAHRAAVRAAAGGRAVMHGALLAAVAGEIAVVTPAVDPPEVPDVLLGSPPAHWRGPRGTRRDQQRAAYTAAAHVRGLLHPPTAGTYPTALAALIRAQRPTTATLPAACARALFVVTPPAGVPSLRAAAVEAWATREGLAT